MCHQGLANEQLEKTNKPGHDRDKTALQVLRRHASHTFLYPLQALSWKPSGAHAREKGKLATGQADGTIQQDLTSARGCQFQQSRAETVKRPLRGRDDRLWLTCVARIPKEPLGQTRRFGVHPAGQASVLIACMIKILLM